MKKILCLALCFVSLTGCIKSSPTLEYVNGVISKFDSYEDLVIVVTETEKFKFRENGDDDEFTTRIRKSVSTHTFSNNTYKNTRESFYENEYCNNYELQKYYSEYIIDFNNNISYESDGNSGMYTQRNYTLEDGYESYYDMFANTSFLSMFINSNFITEYEMKEFRYDASYEIYKTSNNNLTYEIDIEYNEDYYEDYYGYDDYEGEDISITSYTFKTLKIKIPSSEQLY